MGMTHNIPDVQRYLKRTLGQLPFAASRTVNGLALTAQKEIRADLPQHFTVRRRTFLESSIRVKLGTKADPVAEVGVPQRAGSNIDQSLALQEFGGEERPKRAKELAVPLSGARPTPQAITPPSKWPSRLKRAFHIKTAGGQELVLQRVGGKKGRGRRATFGPVEAGKDPGLRVMYLEEPSVTIRPRFHFLDTCLRVVRRDAQALFAKEWANAIRTAR